jgi:hypothetical protein
MLTEREADHIPLSSARMRKWSCVLWLLIIFSTPYLSPFCLFLPSFFPVLSTSIPLFLHSSFIATFSTYLMLSDFPLLCFPILSGYISLFVFLFIPSSSTFSRKMPLIRPSFRSFVLCSYVLNLYLLSLLPHLSTRSSFSSLFSTFLCICHFPSFVFSPYLLVIISTFLSSLLLSHYSLPYFSSFIYSFLLLFPSLFIPFFFVFQCLFLPSSLFFPFLLTWFFLQSFLLYFFFPSCHLFLYFFGPSSCNVSLLISYLFSLPFNFDSFLFLFNPFLSLSLFHPLFRPSSCIFPFLHRGRRKEGCLTSLVAVRQSTVSRALDRGPSQLSELQFPQSC